MSAELSEERKQPEGSLSQNPASRSSNIARRAAGMIARNRIFIMSAACSIFIHLSIAAALIYVVHRYFYAFAGNGNVYPVSYEGDGSGSDGRADLPALPVRSAIAAPALREHLGQQLQRIHMNRIAAPETVKSADQTHPQNEAGGAGVRGGSPKLGGDGGNSFKILAAPLPPYPTAARRAGFEGEAIAEVTIGADGVPAGVTITRSSGREDCDESARITILNRWRFAPLADDARPTREKISVKFKLQ